VGLGVAVSWGGGRSLLVEPVSCVDPLRRPWPDLGI
jgi:hypothetical protein